MPKNNRKYIMKKFGEKVKAYRKLSNYTQEQLAEKCECSVQTISGIETGYSFPSSPILFKISDALNVPLAFLFNFDEDKSLNYLENSVKISKLFSKLDEKEKNVLLKIIEQW